MPPSQRLHEVLAIGMLKRPRGKEAPEPEEEEPFYPVLPAVPDMMRDDPANYLRLSGDPRGGPVDPPRNSAPGVAATDVNLPMPALLAAKTEIVKRLWENSEAAEGPMNLVMGARDTTKATKEALLVKLAHIDQKLESTMSPETFSIYQQLLR